MPGATNLPRAASHQILRQPLLGLLPLKPSLGLALGCGAELRAGDGQGAGNARAWRWGCLVWEAQASDAVVNLGCLPRAPVGVRGHI